MANLRCSKCGGDSAFLIATQDGKSLEVNKTLSTDRILNTVHITCTYCNNAWDHIPVRLIDRSVADRVEVMN